MTATLLHSQAVQVPSDALTSARSEQGIWHIQSEPDEIEPAMTADPSHTVLEQASSGHRASQGQLARLCRSMVLGLTHVAESETAPAGATACRISHRQRAHAPTRRPAHPSCSNTTHTVPIRGRQHDVLGRTLPHRIFENELSTTPM